jgi:2-amino-4-hydroxy-6-hydroxymethyldihydropteridine diphosphokinase
MYAPGYSLRQVPETGNHIMSEQALAPLEADWHRVYLALGSNLGERDANLKAALAALKPDVRIDRVSSVYDTAPQLVLDQPRFHNIACSGRTQLDPFALLRLAKHIERELGRIAGPRYGPRLIDIDLLLYDDLIIDTPELVVPHPRMAERAFVLVPLAEIAPDLRPPTLQADVRSLAAALPTMEVRWLGTLLP